VGDRLEPEHFLLGEEAQALLFEEGAGLGEFVELDDEDGAVVGDEAGAVVEIDVVAAQEVRHGLQGAGLVGNFDGEHFEEGDHQAVVFEGADGGVALVHEELHDAEAAAVGNGDPAYIDAGVSEQFGDAGGLAGFVFDEYGEEVYSAHGKERLEWWSGGVME